MTTNKLPCLDQTTCKSSDAMVEYAEHYFCFSCKKRFPKSGFAKAAQETEERPQYGRSMQTYNELRVRGHKDRGISKAVAEFYGVKAEHGSDREIVSYWYPYGVTKTTGAKVRVLPKEFYVAGELTGLFGQPLFNGGRLLVITEGEVDALTVAQSWYERYSTFYPVVSVSSAAGIKELINQRQWILSFDEVVLWMDDDEPGREASEEAAKALFKEGKKIKVVTPIAGCKDASDVYRNHSKFDESLGEWIQGPGKDAVLSCVWRAREWTPAGIVTSANTWEMYKAEKNAVYIPFAPVLNCFNKTNYGRRMGSITMITAGTGMGKTLLLKEDMFHLHQTRPEKERVGVLSLEESVYEFTIGMMALQANKRIQLPDVLMTDEEELGYWTATMGSDRFILLDHQGSVSDDSIITKIEYMILHGAVYIYLDHVTIAVSESGSNQNPAIDKLMSDLLKLAKRWNVWIGVVSHLRKTDKGEKSFEAGAVPSEDDLKGSGSLKQVPMQTIALSRDKYAEDELERNKTHVHILKDRFTGRTRQFAGSFSFDDNTGRLYAAGAFTEAEPAGSGFVATETTTTEIF